jgi:RNA polymerase sigma factor (sigma-70 family)
MDTEPLTSDAPSAQRAAGDLTFWVGAASTGQEREQGGDRAVHGRLSAVTGKPPFDQVVSVHGPAILRVCRAMLGSPTDAEDAWAETFLAALETYPPLPADANVEAWLVTIAHRKAIDLMRRSARRATPVAELPSTPTEDQRRDLDLHRALTALPDKQRYCVVYHYLIGLPYEEVAGIVGGSAAAARRAAADGIANLRKSEGLIR